MAVTVPTASRSLIELQAAYHRAQQDESAAARRLVDAHFGDEAYAEFIQAAETTILLRGQLYTGRVWTQDDGPALLADWCNCTVKTVDVLYERFNDAGRPVTHGTVCGRCRHVSQVG